ncbi:uncharacterized protein LOC136084825 isoform X2 [Hydra vulgaris]|uniref:Uncharacterized protein LOC136084825 isoform X2 n=1 Tax=Hydra vulgaris TaxID=6087 RepID=A0ABM4CJL3_HYDVU
MRKSICDLTRKFYKYITDIEDHDICNSRKIGGNFSGTSKECKTFDKLEICSGKSREVPGVLPNIFFWTHEGTQTKSKVGLSRINSTEAEMVIGLTKYLVNCGVPKSSIAILTPYKGQLMLMRLSLISLDLLNNKDRENSIVLSTVDRFQGDEADIVIISLVIDAKSSTGFVKKLNRMIVLLSRARLGMYIIGNINYFEEKPDASTCHWTDILTKLRQSCEPDTNPSAVLEKVEDLHYYGPRLGNELPICCPVHREKMVYYAKSVQQLNLNFCKEKCSELLSCEHSCDLLCHFKNKDDHNKLCSVIINPPLCETHAINLTCHELYKNVRISVPICYALKFYKCWEKVSVQLPCLHDCKIYCWEKIEIAEGKRFYPDCEQLAHSTYVYPICCHLLSVLCVVYHQYKKNPTLVKPCKSEVTYNPPCNHSVTVSCFLKQQFENGKLVFTCKKKLKKILPRCGHKASIYCDAFQTLNNWTGQSSELGVVYEGQSYGPADFICKEPVNFIYICKHVTKMACNLAFENASRSNKCHADVEIINPDCGHPTVIKCFQNQLLKNLPLKDPISEIKEGEITLQFNNHLQNHKCTFNILFHRRCGHNEKIQCFKVKNKHIQVCVVSVDINNPLCGHKLSLPCHLSDLNDWKPWKNETCSKFVNNVLFDDCPPPIFPSNELFNYVKRCKSKIIVRRKYCGHQYSIDCGVAFNELSNKTLRICSEVIKDALLNCGHKKTMSCSSYQIYKNDPESYSCTEQVSMSCWNIKNCKEKVLTECCKRSDRYSCKKKIDCTCSNGHTIKKIPICQDGFLMELWIPYAMLEKAQGKVLVIDEAYNLNDKWYGKEVLDVLVEKVQNTESDDIAVLLLGYEPQMREMLREKNPGLARRFAIDYPFVFEDYSESKLFVILKGVCKRENIQMSMEASEAILKLLEKQRAQANFGNAGAIDNVICDALAKVSSRPLTLEGMIELIPSDIGGRDAEKFNGSDPFARLNKLYLVENIRQQLIEIKNTFQVAQTESSIDRPELGHFVFQGAPGTGKTTVARVMAEILFDLGLLLRNHVEVTSGLGLTGEFVGHTKKRVKDKLDAARGGLLFIDEAYELGKGHYGEEAITTLVAAMTDPNYKLVIVIAGYPKDMEQMLSVNVGLKSRFKRFMNFEDWNTNDCINFLRIKAEADNYNFDVDVKNSLHEGLEELRSYPGWGNVRDMLALWQKMLEHRANRVVKMPELNKKIIKLDAMNALKAMVNDRRPKVANAGNINSVLKEASELQIVNQHDHGSQKKLFEVLDESIDDIDVSKRFTKIINPLSFTEKIDSDLEDIRNSGVPDEVWIELQLAKIALKEEKKNEEERQANEKKFQEDQENLLNELLRELQEEREEEKRQQMLQELEKKREEERKRREAEDIRLKEERQKSKDVENAIYKICLCPAGYSWYKQGGGWRCGGGSHFVTDEQLQR